MNRLQAAKLANVIQAYADGQQIQINYDNSADGWKDVVNPSFDSKYTYRVKEDKNLVNKVLYHHALKYYCVLVRINTFQYVLFHLVFLPLQ